MTMRRQLRYGAALIGGLVLLAGCYAGSATDGHSANSDEAKPLPAVSLFGVRIGMVPDELNSAMPGVYCKPTVERPACDVPSTVFGTKGIEVQFVDNRVSSAVAWGQFTNGTFAVSKFIVEQLGPPQKHGRGETWVASDGSELALTNDTKETYNYLGLGDEKEVIPADFVMALTSPASRAQRAEERDRVRREAIDDLAGTLGKYLTIDASGRVSLCGIRVGATFNGHLGCPPSSRAQLLTDAGSSDCISALNDLSRVTWVTRKFKVEKPKPNLDVCVDVIADVTTRQVNQIVATLPTVDTELSTIDDALMALPNVSKLKSSDRPWYLRLSSVQYKNNLGDLLTITVDKDGILYRGRLNKALVVRIEGQPASETSFR